MRSIISGEVRLVKMVSRFGSRTQSSVVVSAITCRSNSDSLFLLAFKNGCPANKNKNSAKATNAGTGTASKMRRIVDLIANSVGNPNNAPVNSTNTSGKIGRYVCEIGSQKTCITIKKEAHTKNMTTHRSP